MALPIGVEAIVRAFHILSAIVWLGFLYFMAFVLPRVIGGLHEDSRRQVMPHIATRIVPWLAIAATSTIFFGAILYWSVGDRIGFANMPMGLNIGVFLAFLMYVLGMSLNVPVGMKTAKVLQGGVPPTPAETRRAMLVGKINAHMSFLVVFFMVSSQRIGFLS